MTSLEDVTASCRPAYYGGIILTANAMPSCYTYTLVTELGRTGKFSASFGGMQFSRLHMLLTRCCACVQNYFSGSKERYLTCYWF